MKQTKGGKKKEKEGPCSSRRAAGDTEGASRWGVPPVCVLLCQDVQRAAADPPDALAVLHADLLDGRHAGGAPVLRHLGHPASQRRQQPGTLVGPVVVTTGVSQLMSELLLPGVLYIICLSILSLC